jgi:hypothetical protein
LSVRMSADYIPLMNEEGFALKDGPKSYWRVLKSVLIDPRRFYGELATQRGYHGPLGFLMISCLVYFIIILAISTPGEAVSSLFVVALVYIIGPCSLMLACQHLFKGEGSYEGTLTVCAYAGAVLTLAWLPVVNVLCFLYGGYLVFLGIQRVHQLEATQAAVATLTAILATAAIIVFAFDVRLD